MSYQNVERLLRIMRGRTVLLEPRREDPMALLRSLACWYLEPFVFPRHRWEPLCRQTALPSGEVAGLRTPVTLALEGPDPAGLPRVTVVVLERDGPGGTVESVRRYTELGSDVTLLEESVSSGFVTACNSALRKADPEADVVLLDGDLEVLAPDWLGELRRVAHGRPEVGVVGCRTVLKDGRLAQAGSVLLRNPVRPESLGRLQLEVGQYARTRQVEAVAGGCVYLTRRSLNRLGLFDEGYAQSCADLDYCLRARRAGLRTMLAGRVTLLDRRDRLHAPRDLAFLARRWSQALDTSFEVELVLRSQGTPEALVDALERAGVKVRLEPDSRARWKEGPRARDWRRRRVSRRATRLRLVTEGQRVRPEEVAWLQPGGRLHREDRPRDLWTDPGPGVDADHFHPHIAGFGSDRFVVLTLLEPSDWAWLEFFGRAFQKAFSREEPVQMRVISGAAVDRPALDAHGAPVSIAVDPIYPSYQRGCLYRSSDCVLVAPGWRTPLEAAACGVPVVAPSGGPQAAFLDADTAQLFDWGEGSLERALRSVYENREEALERASRAASRVLQSWTVEHSAEAAAVRLGRLQKRPVSI